MAYPCLSSFSIGQMGIDANDGSGSKWYVLTRNRSEHRRPSVAVRHGTVREDMARSHEEYGRYWVRQWPAMTVHAPTCHRGNEA